MEQRSVLPWRSSVCFGDADLWNCSLPVLPLLIYGLVVSRKARSRTRRSRPQPFGDALLTGYFDILYYNLRQILNNKSSMLRNLEVPEYLAL
jgi:hypothetical protein